MKADSQTVTNTKILRAPVCVEFDPENEMHRISFVMFKQTGHWPDYAPKFILEKPHLSVPLMISQKLLEYYMKKELMSLH